MDRPLKDWMDTSKFFESIIYNVSGELWSKSLTFEDALSTMMSEEYMVEDFLYITGLIFTACCLSDIFYLMYLLSSFRHIQNTLKLPKFIKLFIWTKTVTTYGFHIFIYIRYYIPYLVQLEFTETRELFSSIVLSYVGIIIIGLLVAVMTVYVIALEYDSEHDGKEYDKRFLIFCVAFFAVQCLIHSILIGIIAQKTICSYAEIMRGLSRNIERNEMTNVVYGQKCKDEDLTIRHYRYISALLFTSCVFLLLEATFFYFWNPLKEEDMISESDEYDMDVYENVSEFNSAHVAHAAINAAQVAINVMERQPLCSSVSENGEEKILLDIKPNTVVEDIKASLIENPIHTEPIRIAAPKVMARQSTKRKKKSVKFKKKKSPANEDPDALTIFECNKCKYKCTNRENFKHHEEFMHSSPTCKRLAEFASKSYVNGSS